MKVLILQHVLFRCSKKHMDGWMDRWLDGWMDRRAHLCQNKYLMDLLNVNGST